MTAGSIEGGLACLGGIPTFEAPIPVGQMYFPAWDRYSAAMRGIFDRGWYTNHGPLARELEERLAAFFGARHAIAVSNATVGLIMAIKCLGLSGKVVVPSFTFIASAQAATWAGLDVVFCDVDPETHQITTEAVEAVMDDDVSAIVAVNLWGGTCIPASLEAFARANGLRLIFDSAHGVGVRVGDVPLGGFGDAEVFSFHATKILSATEGGCVCTNDDELAAKLRNMRSSYGAGPAAVVPLTSNGRFSEAQAAIALMSLEDFPTNRRHNERIHEVYAEGLASVPGLELVIPANTSYSNYQYAVIDVDAAVYGTTRDTLLRTLHAENVISRRYFFPGVHRLVPYDNQERPALPFTEDLCERLIQLPVGALITEENAAKIGDLLARIHADAPAVSAALSSGV
jgi:dTDP-4-amino-4,6-dideoxygalactose transaminase